MSTWVSVQAWPMEPVPLDNLAVLGQAPELWQLRVQKDAALQFDGVSIVCEWRMGEDSGREVWEFPRITIAQQPVGTVLHTFADVGPLKGTVVVQIDRYGGLQADLHYPTLTAPYRLNML